jgi:hypothetical protein
MKFNLHVRPIFCIITIKPPLLSISPEPVYLIFATTDSCVSRPLILSRTRQWTREKSRPEWPENSDRSRFPGRHP